MFGENYAFVLTGKEKYIGFNHLYPIGYKYLSSFKKIGYKLLLINIKETAARLKCFTSLQVLKLM